jgi:antitoxin component YwqK of YwqJK toxin-antitoxin module
VPVGTFTYYYENGKKMAVNHYRGNQGIAMSKQYNEKGVLIAEGKYVGQQRDSIWRIYTDKGIFVAEQSYVNGVPNMVPGLPIMKMELLPNELIMLTEKRKASGYRNIRTVKQKPKAHLQDGSLQGKCSYFDQNGKPTARGEYNKGLKHGVWLVYEEGSPKTKEVWERGKLKRSVELTK